MNKNIIQKNSVALNGEICKAVSFSHSSHGMTFFSTYIQVKRPHSSCYDVIPLLIPGFLMEEVKKESDVMVGRFVSVRGSFRSFNRQIGEKKSRLLLFVYVNAISYDIEKNDWKNKIWMEGYLCKPATYRKTPFNYEISDVMLAVNREHGKKSYIPCICWDDDARDARQYPVGHLIEIVGNIQSRSYYKKLPDGGTDTRVAYEVSVKKITEKSEAVKKMVSESDTK